MKNGYTPKEFAYSIAVDALLSAINNDLGELDGLTDSQKTKAIEQLTKLRLKLAETVNLEILTA